MPTILENIVIDAENPQTLGQFWAEALDADVIVDCDEDVTLRLATPDVDPLDVCLVTVDGPTRTSQRLHLDLAGGDHQDEIVQRLLALGARHLDIGQHDVPWVVLADPEGNAFCVMESRDRYRGTGPIAALPLDCADGPASVPFWMAATGWELVDDGLPPALRHPSGTGPLLELCRQAQPKQAKLPIHLDVRVTPGGSLADEVERLLAAGATRVEHPWGTLPWVVLADPSGNELCVLPPG